MSSTTNKVPFGQKVAFGIGMLANQMFPAALGIFMVVLVQDLGFPGWMWGVIYFFPRLFDCFTDPIMGFISDNTKSRWGRRRQYVFLGALIMGMAFIVMWQLYRVDGVDYNFIYFMLWSFVFYLGLTIFSVPYVAMGYEMSNDFHERTNIMAVAQWIGQWAWVIAPWFWVIMYDPELFPSADIATRSLAVWVGIVCMIFAMVPAIFIKSKSTLNENYSPLGIKTIGSSLKEILSGVVEAFKIVPFRKLCIATFLVFNAFNTIAAFSFFIIVYHLFGGDAGAAGIWPTLFGCLGALGTTFMVIPIVTRMSKKMGKKKAFILSQGISIFGYIMLWFLFVPGKPYMFIFALPFFSFGIGSLFVLMMSMTADVIDLDELNTGKRREGTFGAIYWFMVKFGFAIAGGLSGLIMSSVGFDSGAAIQPEGAIDGLRLAFSGVPILGTLIAMYVMRNYDVTEERANKIRAELDARKNTHKPQSSSYYQTNKLVSLKNVDLNIDTGSDTNFTSLSNTEIAQLFSKSLHGGLHGLCFSPYSESQNIGDQLSESQIEQRMAIIAPYTKWVRSFSCTDGNEYIPIAARNKGLKTMVGAWIDTDKAKNDREINALINLAKQGHVDIAVVGNEALLRKDLTEQDVLDYIAKVKKALPNIPVGYVDAYFQFLERPNLVKACDVILANCYPFWEGCHIDKASTYLKQMHAVTTNVAHGKPVIITETGWPNKGENTNDAKPSHENAMKYFINANNWANQNHIEMFYFSSFDESWKVHHEGDVGQRWGLWDKNEHLKY
ncbi:GPH family glycoside/pentoside/hexuronide:cation symporter [Mariniflexile fucanivorans]|uniref:Endo-1,3-beta-glucanase btgC n=1 Tax=Mariniflexile fucanivorans TaxID=264023 RepID=A0A4R1RSC9_9FLAO|nr:MFS transporter [Mariniflexile fucanivorans]TCL69266.1 GPH family glycoside/pentoside/hexuronide:cation symporter [Mariniflexile fucanivorans]